jgi:thioester reductase-like protein
MARAGWDEVVVLTGFPSLLARKTCVALLAEEKKRLVHLVVRAKFMADAERALAALPSAQRERVNVLEGDAAAMDLGLSGPEFRALAAEVDTIHHCAAVSYPGVDRKTAEHVNVGGAAEILELASACRSLRCLVHHSTASVSGDRSGLVLEEELDAGQSFHNVVEETRARAERMMRRAMSKLPICVLRPTIVIGDSKTGEVDRLDGPYLLILLMLTSPADFAMPLPGRGDASLNLVPVDYVARAACIIGSDSRAIGKTFHLADPAPLPARRVFELVARAGGVRTPRGFIPANLTKALLRTPGIERFLRSPRAFLDTLGTNVTFSTKNTDALLEGTDVRCPPFETYVDAIVAHARGRLRERREAENMTDPLDG